MTYDDITPDERKTLSVLAFLFLRMGLDARAKRVYEALAELSPEQSRDAAFAQLGVAAVSIETGDGKEALKALDKAVKNSPLVRQHAVWHLFKAQALWLEGRKDEAQVARDEFLLLSGQMK